MRILLEGRPGSGKSTIARRLADGLREDGIPVTGFVTEEIRESGRRLGFSIERLGGERGVLAHVEFPGPPRVGRYGVDLAPLEQLAVPALEEAGERDVVIIDELGKMELASRAFRDAVSALIGRPVPVVATVQSAPHPVHGRPQAAPGRRDASRHFCKPRRDARAVGGARQECPMTAARRRSRTTSFRQRPQSTIAGSSLMRATRSSQRARARHGTLILLVPERA